MSLSLDSPIYTVMGILCTLLIGSSREYNRSVYAVAEKVRETNIKKESLKLIRLPR